MKSLFIKTCTYLILFLLIDIFFSNFIYKSDLKFSCVSESNKNGFYNLKKNCKAKEKYIRNVKSYKVLTEENGLRYSGKKFDEKKKNVLLFGDSFTYGLGLDYEKIYAGILENSINNYNFLNFGVIGYSPSVYYYQLKKFVESGQKFSKIILTVDITDFHEEASGWEYNDAWSHPRRIIKKTKIEIEENDNFKERNFKGSRFIASLINNFFRNIKYNFRMSKSKKNLKPEETSIGNFLYKETDPKLWAPIGFENSKKKIEDLVKLISEISNNNQADFYILIYPWPDTLEFGQKNFNLENYASNLCLKVNCKSLINTFLDFKKYKYENEDWLNSLYINGDLHLSKIGHQLIADQILKKAFNKN